MLSFISINTLYNDLIKRSVPKGADFLFSFYEVNFR